MDESLEVGVYRKLKEKTGIENVYTEQLYTFGDILKTDIITKVYTINSIINKKNNKIKIYEI